MSAFIGAYKFAIEELPEPGHLRLTVSQHTFIPYRDKREWIVTDIIDGPYVFIINRLTAYYDDERRLRKVKR